MTDWKARAAAADPPVPAAILGQVIAPLEALETAFRALEDRIPADGLPWTPPAPPPAAEA
jgi:hypothetical protein